MRRAHARFLPLLSLCLFGLAWTAPTTVQDASSAPRTAGEVQDACTTVFLVRHAEKASDDPRDPTLSEVGLARAEALASLLSRAGVTGLYASQYKRTQMTLEPLSRAAGGATGNLPVKVVDARDAAGLARELSELPPGSVAVVAGHSNTVPSIAKALSCELTTVEKRGRGRMLAEDEYDRLFVLTLPPKDAKGVAPSYVELRYGAE